MLRLVAHAWVKYCGQQIIADPVQLIFCDVLRHKTTLPPFPKLTDTTTLFVERCNPEFVWSYLNKTYFPNLERLYLASHIYDSAIFDNFPKTEKAIVNWARRELTDTELKEARISIISQDEYDEILKKFKVN